MATFRPPVKPELLRWARERAGVALADAEAKVPQYANWERGDARPTMKQLDALARRFHVPLGLLFLPEPPEVTLPIPDFRSAASRRPPSAELLDVLAQMEQRQEWMRAFLTEEGEQPLPFVGSARVGDPIEAVAQSIRQTLGLERLWAAETASQDDALRRLREAIEQARILVFMMGYVGHTRRTFDVSEFRGFVLSDPIAPLVLVNSRDAGAAQMFTLAHELVHLWVDQDALFDLPRLQPADAATEQFCDRVAAEFLVPAAEFEQAWTGAGRTVQNIQDLARRFRVSQIVVARRALDLGHVSRDDFFAFYEARQAEVDEARVARQEAGGGGNFWNTQGTRIGKLFGPAVVRAVQEGRLLYTDAYELTGLRARSFDTYASQLTAS